MKTRWLSALVVCYLSFAQIANAHDLGVYARVWAIQEVNVKQIIAEQLSQVDVKSINENLKDQAKNFGANLTPFNLPLASQTATNYFDPSIALKKDIVVRGRLIYKAGTWVNPLKVVRPQQDMLFFNGNDPDQLQFALDALKLQSLQYRLILVMTEGNPIELANKIHFPVSYATPGIIQRFHITQVPTLLGVGLGQYQYNLAVTTFAKPYSVNIAVSCFNGCQIETN